MTRAAQKLLINLFWEELYNWDWESWINAGAREKESIVTCAILESGLEVNIDEAFDLFWEWASGLGEEDFGRCL